MKNPKPDRALLFLRRFITALILLLPAFAEAQRITPAPEAVYLEACEYMLAGDYQEALSLFLGLRGRGNESAGLGYRIGECYLNLPGQRWKALSYLQEVSNEISASWVGDDPTEDCAPPKALLYLGIAGRLNERYDEAERAFQSYILALDPADSLNRALAISHIARCRNARVMMAGHATIKIDTLPEIINGGRSNYNPVLPSDKMQLFYMNRLQFYDAPMASQSAGSEWLKAENLTPDIGSDGDHLLTGISPDGNALLFSYNDPMTGGDIYLTEFKDGKWSSLKKLESPVNTQFNESHASISSDGSLYFTSDRKGGYGGLDIYHAFKNAHGNWDSAVNLGSAVNTPFNEESPFVAAGQEKLFFSSQGHYNMGGFDVFRSDADGAGGWLPPVNLGYPLNTSDDDLFFFPTGKGETGYTYRYPKASAESDLVMVRMISPGNPARFTVRGSVSVPDDDTTGLRVRISNAADRSLISLIPLKAGTFSQALPAGEYTVDFTRNNMLLLQKSMRIPDFLPQDDLILTAELPATDKMTIDTIRLADILFEFDQSELSAKYNPLLDKLTSTMLKFPSLQVTLSGYSDARGNKTYNLKLSRARAEAVAMYLNRKPGIAPRVTIRAFGELNAVALNQTIEGEDLSEGRKYNRRVEIQLVPVTDGLVVETERDIPGSLRAK